MAFCIRPGKITASVETFLRRPGATLIDDQLLARKAYVRLEFRSELTLIEFAGSGLERLGATAEVVTAEVVHGGLHYDVPQAWSKALVAHPAHAHGIVYHARHDGEALCYAIHDRMDVDLIEKERRTDLDQDWFCRLAMRYGVGMAPS